jgi:sterol desaturase/sphingolipid hydroxylase (fatty acid hydroxylase superfamily)
VRSGLPGWVTPAVIAGGFLLFALLETLRPLRRRRESRLPRAGRNFAMAGLGFAVIELLQIPLLLPISRRAAEGSLGLLGLLGARGLFGSAAAILLLDYTLWHWHRVNHRVSFFWRFHSVHHVDRDMDASTALRFHFGELGMSVGFRALQVLAIGADPLSVAVYQALLFGSVFFHHSNTRLPIRFERFLVKILVTPRMHGIHHSDYRNETDSNWSSFLSLWDYLHGTILLDVPQQSITIGVPAFDDAKKVTLGRLLGMPFQSGRRDWRRADGSPSERPHRDPERAILSP